MRYLVTGGLGVIGSLFARRMIAAGHDVTIIDCGGEPRNDWIEAQLREDAEILNACVEDFRPDDMAYRLSKCDAVLHAAAHTGIPHSIEDPSDDWQANVEGTRALLEGLRIEPRPTVVLSSVKPYKITAETMACGLIETDVLEPDEPYAASKAAQSMLCQAYAQSYQLPITTFRCSNLYGAAPCHGPRHGWLTWFCISAALGHPLNVQGTGEQSRDMLHANDVSDAVHSALLHMWRAAGNNTYREIYNLGGGLANKVSVMQVARYLNELTGVEIREAPARAMDDDCVFVDFGKFERATGWRPRVSVMEGIREVLAWAQQNTEALRKLYEGL